eukprot:TRINITY_DN17811_c0_g1_i1.p1 TRINITY_DN17811_c0_g1~~TRINITY_DN17811_c0_g1_i1.p1  ORF type:complete len:177 (-),score=25.72 TRINITY_DN17811_c0_g1_i1:312-842(-)
MIIKGLFRRYVRWNPVHPTYGAFWGMGIGIGCGVGWGPGFGPEVIGYVGAGCGVGFSVGITLAGVGIGLPINYIFEIPYNAFSATRSGAVEFCRSSAIPAVKNIAGDSWNLIGPHVSGLQREASGKICNFKVDHSLGSGFDLNELKKSVTWHARPAFECFISFKDRCLPPDKGSKD